jgi:hypothetical protein
MMDEIEGISKKVDDEEAEIKRVILEAIEKERLEEEAI